MKPKAFISNKTDTIKCLTEMLKCDPQLYDKCISTLGFAYCFGQISNRAVHFDYLLQKGIIPKDYIEVENEKTETL